jgi:hypothetical protein
MMNCLQNIQDSTNKRIETDTDLFCVSFLRVGDVWMDVGLFEKICDYVGLCGK